jgi:uncharacterized membrane protein YdfJ with MMPL/SSD domain
MLGGILERRPWVIIAVWLIIAIAAIPLASNVNSIVKTETESFLPEHVESIRAERMLSQLYNQTGTRETHGADYMILVHGVPVSLDSYKRLRSPYHELKEEYQVYSWIDIADSVLENATGGMKLALNGSLAAIDGLLRLNYGYIQTLQAVNSTSMLIRGADIVFTGLYRNMSMIANNSTELLGAANLTLAACNSFLLLYTFYRYTLSDCNR